MAARRLTTVLIIFITLLVNPSILSAGPTSNNYELKQYGFGAGGMEGGSSNSYALFGIAGEVSGDQGTSTTYKANEGLVYTLQANVPPAPTFTNPATNYDRLKIVITTGNNPTDALFAIAISIDNFITANYVQNDNTVGTTLGAEDWQTYTNWGGASGEFITGLSPNTEYKVKVKAIHGDFTETGYGPEATQTTSEPSLTFGIDAAAVTFTNLNSGNSYTDSAKSTVLTTSTNAYNGYVIYGRETGALTSGSNQIPNYSAPNSAPTTWSSTGFGYSTNDTSLSGGTADRFTNGGPKYAGFDTAAPGDPVADHTQVIEEPAVSNEQFTVSYRVTADAQTAAGEYRSTILYVIVPTY